MIGSLWLEADQRAKMKEAIKNLRSTHRVFGEFKWQRVSPSRQSFYTDLVELFFDSPMRFRVIVLPADQLDAIQFHYADNELMFYKFYYQLLHHWILDFNSYRIFIDVKTNRVKEHPPRLRQILDRSNLLADVVSVQALPSDQLDLMQLTDMLIGAVGYSVHSLHSSTAKLAVIAAIETKIGHSIQATTRGENKFNVFRWKPGGGW